MSHAATNWANRQKTGCPQAKCILQAIADEADSSGVAIVGVPWLAEATEQGQETVRRWLKKMEQNGLLIRFERAGKKSEFRLAMGAAAVPRDRLHGDADPPQSEGTHPPQSEGGTSNEEYIPPQSPPRGAVGSVDREKGNGAGTGDEIADRLEAFKAVYPCPTTRPGDLERLFGALTPDEAAEVMRGAAGYAVHCQREKRRAMDPVKFVRDRALWAEFAHLAPPPAPDKAFVACGTDAWAAWAVHNAIVGAGAMPRGADGPGGRRGAMLWAPAPPGGLALAAFATAAGAADLANWTIVRHATKQWWAWAERVKKWGCGALEPDLVTVPGERSTHTLNGRTFDAPVKVKGLLLPSEWPPPLGGKSGAREAGPAEPKPAAQRGEVTR